jgi:hypothetical protein
MAASSTHVVNCRHRGVHARPIFLPPLVVVVVVVAVASIVCPQRRSVI